MKIKNLLFSISNRWKTEGGYKEFITLAFPLILSTSSWSIQHFIDRMFLTWYSPSAIAASMPSGMLNFTLMSIFMGTASYVGTFVAQYYGAKKNEIIGPAVWQGIYISVLGSLILLVLAFQSGNIFNIIGHDLPVRKNEIIYFQILCLGAFPELASGAMSGFFSGLGKTWTVMWVNIIGTLVNIILDYLMIFGYGGFPEWGMKGAAIATVLSGVSTFLMYFVILAKSENNKLYNTLKGWKFNWRLLKRIVWFGFPSGLQFFIDIAGFTLFILILGSLGTTVLAATNIAFNINTIAFMPMIGGGIAISVLVGQYLGKNRPDIAEKSVYSAFHITFGYMASISLLYVILPSIFILPFATKNNQAEFAVIQNLVIILLRFVAAYSLFDTMNIVFESAIKGAGDTHYVFKVITLVSLFVLVLPSYAAIKLFHGGIYMGWTIVSVYIALLGFVFLFRFLSGKWKSMRVIECHKPGVPIKFPEVPSVEY
ncbi:MAG: MATE family efflux transporter [Elusimicrobia bacterium]|nr:MATE family efflux transporter [Elusimicrobiota bacterium]